MDPDLNMFPVEGFDSVSLDRGSYGRYFNLLHKAFSALWQVHQNEAKGGDYEGEAMVKYLSKLLYTVQVLRLKFSFGLTHDRSLWVDCTDSGFPNRHEIANLAVDLVRRAERLLALPPEELVKEQILNNLFKCQEDQGDLLWVASQLRYLGMIDKDKVFFEFCPGELKLVEEKRHIGRTYVFSWACYDFSTNRPYLHIMTFEHDWDQQSLESDGKARDQFFQVISAEGSRAPQVGVLAIGIDSALEHVHPKIMKRITLGPLYAALLVDGCETRPFSNVREETAYHLLKDYGKEDDFILFFTDEIVFSKRQQISQGFLSLKSKVREIFHIPETDPEAYRRQASQVHASVILPHVVLQHALETSAASVLGLDKLRVVSYDQKGVIYGTK